jgi:superfamily II RNA helicase
MVKICSLTYPKENEEQYNEYFKEFKYPLHDFQKWGIEGIVTKNHVLVTAPTGSGKSLVAEFSLNYFHSLGKKTIYCSPIKALSNEKFHDFTRKYPHITIGLITGDIKTNPDADVLIMTTEILLNKLFQLRGHPAYPPTQGNTQTDTPRQSGITFDMDIMNDLGCVVFDEIHFIGDPNRGHVWENSIMTLPSHIQIIGLSATLGNPEQFAHWLEIRDNNFPTLSRIEKIVYLANKKDRAIPLVHYSFITATQGIFKVIKDKETQTSIREMINKPFMIQDSKGNFKEDHYHKMHKMLTLFETKNHYVKPSHALNEISKYLVENELLPAFYYVFSKKQIEKYAKELNTNLLEFDSKIPYTVDYECEQVMRKLPNFQEYIELPEYVNIIKLMRKGIGMHHAGLMPVLRELVEIMFSKGFIKVLFCTETMSIGINLPVRSCVFTDVNKFDGKTNRILESHEYSQSSGRSGRLGLDTIGHVFHLNNIFRNVDMINYKKMMNGKPQILVSKFKISYHLLLNFYLSFNYKQNCTETDKHNCIETKSQEFTQNKGGVISQVIERSSLSIYEYSKKSMIHFDINSQLEQITHNINGIKKELDNIDKTLSIKTPIEIIEKYIHLQNEKKNAVNKKRKEIEKNIQDIQDNYKCIESEQRFYLIISEKQNKIRDYEKEFESVRTHMHSSIKIVEQLLINEGFLNENELTIKGRIASQLRELHCLVFADLRMNHLSSSQLISIFSCFTNITVPDNFKEVNPNSKDMQVNDIVSEIIYKYNKYNDFEVNNHLSSGSDYNMHFDLLNYVIEWCECDEPLKCKILLQKMENEKEIFLGEFVKALLKINNISCEMEKIAEMMGDVEYLQKLKEIPIITLKFIVTNQSLYV